jgi:hypothetical protein
MSASLPNSGRKMVSVSIYAIAIHSMAAIETPNLLLSVGIATLTMLTSSADIVAPSRTVDRMNHLKRGCAERFDRRVASLPFMFILNTDNANSVPTGLDAVTPRI